MEPPFKNCPLEIKPPKNINLLDLYKNTDPLVSGYLMDKDLANFFMGSD